jgi:hypothetical protein
LSHSKVEKGIGWHVLTFNHRFLPEPIAKIVIMRLKGDNFVENQEVLIVEANGLQQPQDIKKHEVESDEGEVQPTNRHRVESAITINTQNSASGSKSRYPIARKAGDTYQTGTNK